MKHLLQTTRRCLWLTLYRGPKCLVTTRISVKCATLITAMCLPSLLCSGVLVIPGLVFQAPYQNAYFYFAQFLETEPARWVAMGLSGVCAWMSLALPATMPPARQPVLY